MRKRILIVEDDPLVAMVLEEYLEALGQESSGAIDNVAAALACINAGNIDLAIVDVHLGNGETAEPIAEALNAHGIAFMITTGGFIAPPGPAFAERPVLLKPVTFASLEKALNDIELRC